MMLALEALRSMAGDLQEINRNIYLAQRDTAMYRVRVMERLDRPGQRDQGEREILKKMIEQV